MTKLNRHYLFLLIALVLLGPQLSSYIYRYYMMLNGFYHGPDWWYPSGKIYSLLMVPFLITGALAWALRLRRSWRAFLALTPIALLGAGFYSALFSYFSYGVKIIFDGPLAVCVILPTLALLERGLPPANPGKKTPQEKALQQQYLRLLLNMALLGPLVGFLVFILMILMTFPFITLGMLTGGPNGDMLRFILDWLRLIYSFGFAPALITGALIWALQLRRNWVGVIVTVVLGFIGTGLRFRFFINFFPLSILVAAAGTLSALFFSRYLPRPAAASSPLNSSPDKNHD